MLIPALGPCCEALRSSGALARRLANHVPFAQAGIPSISLLDAESPFLHTADDTPERLDADSLAKTGKLILYFVATPATIQ